MTITATSVTMEKKRDEPVEIGKDIYQHPRTTMDENAEFLINRPLKVKLIEEL